MVPRRGDLRVLPRRHDRARERPQRLLQQGPVRALRLHHRRGDRPHALRRHPAAHPQPGHGRQVPGRTGRDHRRLSGMAWGFNPDIMDARPVPRRLYLRGREHLAPIVATGFDPTAGLRSPSRSTSSACATCPSAGASPLPPSWAPSWPRWSSASAPSAARTPCPAPSRTWTYRPRSSPSPSAVDKLAECRLARVQGRRSSRRPHPGLLSGR